MIKAIVFDMDGVLVNTEKLKGLSYAMAVQKIRRLAEPDPAAIEAYREVVGASREEAVRHIIQRLDLERDLRRVMPEYGASTPEQTLSAIRLGYYKNIVSDQKVIRENTFPHTIELLRVAKETSSLTGLATMSQRPETEKILRYLGLEESFNVVVTADEITRGKPDPEIYFIVADRLGVPPQECLVIEDSANGVQAGLAAGMNVVAFATPFTTAGLHSSKVITDIWIVHEPESLAEIVRQRIEEHNRSAHGTPPKPATG